MARRPYRVLLIEQRVVERAVVVLANSKSDAASRAIAGKELITQSEVLRTSTPGLQSDPELYSGPRFVMEQEPGDPDYWNVYDTWGKQDAQLSLSYEEAKDIVKHRCG